ncbi:hypothetical protein VB774_15845 [Pseudanabaena galeata UHCC 0370]|uniref:Uncharacterized protein n=1 Tax=Pseudanabaena galeata UHCC 0370 TaxID=3110310 RepID=A0ABU5TLF7_9CYAN|nr:hypothetical protein [Pseudanabaena galeata]MEA5479094.1 hypothetical protein [Pseudanabaena galeata UHCC 0370]
MEDKLNESDLNRAVNHINDVSQALDPARRELISYQLKFITGLNNILLMPDMVTLSINAVERSHDKSSLGVELADFIHGVVVFAKAEYFAAAEKSRKAAFDLLKSTAHILIGNVVRLAESVATGIGAAITTLRDLFLGEDSWITKLIDYFAHKANFKQTEEKFVRFVEITLQKISREPLLMNQSKLYSEIAYDHEDMLLKRKKQLLEKDYPKLNKFQVLSLVGLTIVSIPIVLLSIFFGGCLVYLFVSNTKRMLSKEKELEVYKSWLGQVQSYRYQN